MKLKCFNTTGTNLYLVYCEATGETLIIDPCESDTPIRFIGQSNLKPVLVVATHGHIDHINKMNLTIMTHSKFKIHRLDEPYLYDKGLNLAFVFGIEYEPIPVDGYLESGEEICIGEEKMKVLHTPGHTPGSISLYREGILFCGDLVFKSGIGRYDLPGSSFERLRESIDLVLKLPQDTIVYPGHGESTSIGEIKRWYTQLY